MKLISWNVNGIRAILKKDFLNIIGVENPDIVCLQEIKAHPNQVDKIMHDYEHQFWNAAEKKGYSGTAIFSKIKPISVNYGIGIEEHDNEGRIITAEFEKFFLVNVYVPNSGRGTGRLDYRQMWDRDLLNYIKNLDSKKPVLVCGDLNVAHKDIDLKNAKENYNKTSGYMQEEIDGINNILTSGFIDTWRRLNPEKIQYTWWSYMFNARNKGIGWRIDYWIASERFMENIKNSEILDHIWGSDHCPVRLELKENEKMYDM